jgi:two-component sensor histidine kinase
MNHASDSIRVLYLLELGSASANAQNEGEGFKYLRDATSLAEKTQNKHLIDGARIQMIEFYRKVRDYESAQALVKKLANDIPKEIKLQCSFYHRASAVYSELYNAKNGTIPEYLDTALYYSFKSLAISKKHNLYDAQYISYRELSVIYSSTSFLYSLSTSKLYLDSALVILKNKDELEYYTLMKAKSYLFLTNKEYDLAITYAKKSLLYIEKVNNYQLQMELYWVLTQSYLGLNDSLLAYKYMIKEAQSNIKYKENFAKIQLAELTTAYKVEEKDKLITEKENALIQAKRDRNFFIYIGILLFVIILLTITFFIKSVRKNKLLAKLMKENDFLVGESNHRIKNNLQLIISLIGREIYKGKNDEKTLDEISEKINSIATLHKQLYLDKSKEEIEIKKYIEEILQNFETYFIKNNIKLSTNLVPFSLSMDKAVYLGLLITELLTNSIKHAFTDSENNEIKIEMDSESSGISFIFKDNGRGLNQNQTPALVNLLVKQLKSVEHPTSSIGFMLKIKFKK